MDLAFHEQPPKLFPHTDAKSWFVGNQALIEATAFRNGRLRDADKVNAAFFSGTTVKTNFICSLGYGDPAGLFPRSPRPEFAEVCTIA